MATVKAAFGGRVERVNFDERSSVPGRFVFQLADELPPTNVMDGLAAPSSPTRTWRGARAGAGALPQNLRMRRKNMSESQAQTAAQQMIGDFAPKLVSLTDDVLFGDSW